MRSVPYIFCLLLIFPFSIKAQSIYSALHLNEEMEYKTARPKKIIETNIFFNKSGKKIDKNIKLFDTAGMIISEERFDENGNAKARLTYTNDTINRIILSRTFEVKTAVGNRVEVAWYSYDDNHFLVRVTDKTLDGRITGTTEIKNNEKGLPVELITYDANGKPFGKETAEYIYDRNVAIVKVYNNNGKELSTDSIALSFRNAYQFAYPTRSYNEKGDLLTSQSKSPNGTVTYYEYEYKYDKFGNCLEMKIYKVFIASNGKKKRKSDRIFKKQYFY